MRVMFTISAYGPVAPKAVEVKEKIEEILKQYGLSGDTKGMNYDQFASFCGTYAPMTEKKTNEKYEKYGEDEKNEKEKKYGGYANYGSNYGKDEENKQQDEPNE